MKNKLSGWKALVTISENILGTIIAVVAFLLALSVVCLPFVFILAVIWMLMTL